MGGRGHCGHAFLWRRRRRGSVRPLLPGPRPVFTAARARARPIRVSCAGRQCPACLAASATVVPVQRRTRWAHFPQGLLWVTGIPSYSNDLHFSSFSLPGATVAVRVPPVLGRVPFKLLWYHWYHDSMVNKSESQATSIILLVDDTQQPWCRRRRGEQ